MPLVHFTWSDDYERRFTDTDAPELPVEQDTMRVVPEVGDTITFDAPKPGVKVQEYVVVKRCFERRIKPDPLFVLTEYDLFLHIRPRGTPS